MIVGSIDLMGGRTVQLVGGERDRLEVDAGDPAPLLERFSLAGEVAVIDLDAAMGRGSNRTLIERLVKMGPCRVGGGIRDIDTAIHWLDAGARKIIIGTAATPELLRELPAERVIAALDARDGEVVDQGWQRRTGRGITERMRELNPHVGGYLVTFVEREGRMGGTDLARVEEIVAAAGGRRVTIAGGVTTAEEVAALDALGADAQVGMALYRGKMDFADAIVAPMRSDRPDGLWPTVIVDEHGVALGLAYSNAESVREAVRMRRGVYWSRSRGGLWVKGESSGAMQDLLGIALDCDRDALRFTVTQAEPGFCHEDTRTCWGEDAGIGRLARRLTARVEAAPEGSYTRRLLTEPGLLAAKLVEEARELSEARTPNDVAWEAADVIYFAMVAAARAGVPLRDVAAHLDRRELKVTRRRGDAKPDAEG